MIVFLKPHPLVNCLQANRQRSTAMQARCSETLIVTHTLKARHSGMDCRNPRYRDVQRLPSLALDTHFPAGMTAYLNGFTSLSGRQSSLLWERRVKQNGHRHTRVIR